MAPFDDLNKAIAAQSNVEDAVELLLDELAKRIKATSNDQNIQKLARELKAAAPGMARAIVATPATVKQAG